MNYVLTDLFPNENVVNLNDSNVIYRKDSIDAASLPPDLASHFRTSFGSFHHLSRPVAKSIFQDVISSNAGIAIFELSRCDFTSILFGILMFPLAFKYITIFKTPDFTLFRALFSFIVPLLPSVLMIDGVLSCLRTYTEKEYNQIVDSIPGAREKYSWTYQVVPIFDFEKSIVGSFAFGRFLCRNIFDKMLGLNVFTGIPKQ